MDASLVVFCLEYTWINRVAPTHDLNAILFPPNSESTVRCIAVLVQQPSRHFYLNLAKIPPNQVIADFGRGSIV